MLLEMKNPTSANYIKPMNQFQSMLPVRGATVCYDIKELGKQLFQSTLPARGATVAPSAKSVATAISIHAPREGSDVFVLSW